METELCQGDHIKHILLMNLFEVICFYICILQINDWIKNSISLMNTTLIYLKMFYLNKCTEHKNHLSIFLLIKFVFIMSCIYIYIYLNAS